ncbi:MAG: DUF3822 family protein [Bacteroidales bacterium]|nr:DUF3822 family protein [Bacteroidales bacterium]
MNVKNSVIDYTSDLSPSEKYSLSIRISRDGLSFLVFQDSNKRIAKIKHYSTDSTDVKSYCFWLNRILNQEDVLSLRFEKVLAIYIGFQSTFVPTPLFDKTLINKYFNLNFSLQEHETILYSELEKFDVQQIYSIPICIKEALEDRFSNISIKHHSSSLLSSYKESSTSNLAYFTSRFFTLIIFNEMGIQFQNSFKYQKAEDVLFFILRALNSQNYDPKAFNLKLLSEPKWDADHSILNLLKNYISNIDLGKIEPPTIIPSELQIMAQHEWLLLANSIICE